MPDNPSAWLVSVANNIVRDERRSTSRREKLLTQWVSRDDGMDSPLSSEARMIQEEGKAVVRRALGTLRPRDQRLLILRHEGFSYREIAEVLGIAPTSVGTLLVRATTALAKAYRELDHASE
jgi:RNA polymerase sigma-70 factor, ECF subfamily